MLLLVERQAGTNRTPVETRTGINNSRKTPPPGILLWAMTLGEQEHRLLAVL